MRETPHRCLSTCVLLVLFVGHRPAVGQEAALAPATPSYSSQVQQVQIMGPDGKMQVITRPAGAPGQGIAPGRMPPKMVRPGEKPGDPKKEGDKGKEDPKKEGEAGKDGKKGEAEKPKTIQREEEPPEPADPKELNVAPDDDGMVQFSFRGQKWPDVLDWLSRVSGMSLDWQELPNDYLNLTTRRRYSIEDARDLINRHLLSRGFTLLESGEVLSVSKIENIDPSMVPRVDPQELSQRRPHEFVKVSFTLDWLIAETAVEEFKPMLSPNGKLYALKTTNRIEAMDAVANLREILDVLIDEQSDSSQQRLFREFVLQYAKASDVVSQLQSLLGIQKQPSAPAAMSRQQMEMMQQQQQRMMAEMQKRSGQKAPTPTPKAPQVQLVVNPRKNSILAKAPPDQMVIIDQAIKSIDVPTGGMNSLLANPTRMQVYRLHAIDPEPLTKTLEEVGQLDPSTRLEVDEKNKAIIAFASLADHVIIRSLVDRLDGSGRQFEVVQLRRLAADYVAGTIEFMMGGKKETEQSSRYDYYSMRYGRRNESEQSGEFKVDADIESNRLLLWANEIEIEEVMNLLVKLGELPPEGGGQSTVRVLDALPPDEAAAFLERLKKAWPSLAPNKLELPTIRLHTPDDESSSTEEKPAAEPAIDARDARMPATSQVFPAALYGPADDPPALDAANDNPGAAPSDDQPPAEVDPADDALRVPPSNPALIPTPSGRESEPPPIILSIGPDGKIVITSRDSAALDLLEEVIDQLAPPRRDYEVFKLKYADAYWVKDNLEEYFEEEGEDDSYRSRYFFYGYPEPSKSEGRSRLSSRRKLKFIYDLDTNSILVQGADLQQLKTIDELIEFYDQPEPTESQTARVSAVFHIKYSKASVIADAIKDVYRDLLSSNDKALGQNPEQKNRSSGSFSYILGDGGSSAPERTKATFKGKLSVGIDEITNTLLVSAEGENLLQNISKMVETLDEAAKPASTVSVVRLNGGVNAEHVRDVLSRVLSESGQGAAKTPANAAKPPQPGNNGPRSSTTTRVLGVAPR